MSTAAPHRVKLPSGDRVFCLSRREARVVYDQVQSYFRNGIAVGKGDIVFDVGANIGLFTLEAYRRSQGTATVYAFEPIPAIFEVLQRNARQADPERLRPFPFGLAAQAGEAVFEYHVRASVLSTACPDVDGREREELKHTALRNFRDAAPGLSWLPPFLRGPLIDFGLTFMAKAEPVTCQLRTLSEVIAEQRVTRIDLLKVDAERAELDVLLGLGAHGWPKVRQAAVEVHDIEGRVARITDLFREHGLTEIVVEQEPAFRGSYIFSAYARRP